MKLPATAWSCPMGAAVMALRLCACLAVGGLPLLAGCELVAGSRPGATAVAAAPAAREAPAEDAEPARSDAPSEPVILQRGTDRMVAMPQQRPQIVLVGEAVSLDFEETPLTEVVHAVIGDVLGLDYVVEHPIKGQITLRTRSPIPRLQLLPILESLLRSNGAFMIRDPNDRIFISSSQEISKVIPEFSSPDNRGAGFSNVVIPLQYIGANEMADILRPVAGDEAFVRIDPSRNLLVLGGTRNQVDGWLQIINTFDVDQLEGMSVGVFPIQHSSVEGVIAALGEVVGGADGGAGGDLMDGEGAAVGAPGSLRSLIRFLPLGKLDSVLVITPRSHYLERVADWIEKLDQPMDVSGEATLHVYPVQNGDAGQMAELLQGLLGGGTAGGGGLGNDTGVAPGLTPLATNTGGATSQQGRGNRMGAARQFSVGDDIRIIADRFNNSLLIYAPLREYRKIEAALKKLDVVPKQVLIEASILEVQLIDGLQYGIEWAFNGGLGRFNGDGLLALGDNEIGPRVPGFSYTLTDSADAVRAVVNALADQSLVNVISTPSIMVLDNNTASIQVGDQQPIQSAQTVTNGGNITQSIEFKDTGVLLEVTPTVNAGGLVTMDISQSVTDVGLVDSATGQRSFLKRDVESRVAIRSGESVVLGGLIRDNSSTGNVGIPILKDIPVIGALFGGTNVNSTRTELLVFITPRVVRDEQDLRDISREMRERMKGIQYFGDLPLSAQPSVTPGARQDDAQ